MIKIKRKIYHQIRNLNAKKPSLLFSYKVLELDSSHVVETHTAKLLPTLSLIAIFKKYFSFCSVVLQAKIENDL